MSAYSQFTGGLPVGASLMMPDLAPIVTLTDSSVWLRSGVFVSPASYPRAAALPHMKAISVSRINYTFGNVSVSAASDGAGVILTSVGSGSANIDRSTDGGVTWASVAMTGVLGGLNPHAVYRFNGKFWAVANDATSIYVAESATGATGTWTQRAVATGLVNLTAGTALLDWTGTNLVLAVQSLSTTTGLFTSPTGVTWTVRTLGFALNGLIGLAAAASGGTVVVQRTNSYMVSTDHGVTWDAGQAAPSSAQYKDLFSVGSRFFTSSSIGLVSTTTPANGASWARVNLPVTRMASASANSLAVRFGFLSGDRAAFYTHVGGAAGASGLLRFNASGEVEYRATDRDNLANSSAALVVEPGRCVFLNNSTNSSRAACDFDTVNALAAGYESGASSTTPQASYTRVA